MKDCLYTKLKGVVISSGNKFGYISLNIVETQGLSNGSFSIKRNASDAGYEVIAEGGYFATSAANLLDPATRLTSHTFSNSVTNTIYVPNSTFKIYIKVKYENIDLLKGLSTNVVINVEDLNYLTVSHDLSAKNAQGSITGIKVFETVSDLSLYNIPGLSGNISAFLNNTSITACLISATNVEGDVANFSKATSLTRLFIGTTNISGTLESLCEGQIQNGRTSGTLTVRSPNNNVTLHNTETTGEYSIAFSNGGCSISLNNVVVASYNGSTWTYT